MSLETPTHDAPASKAFARWSIALLIAINLFNFIDRQVLSAVTVQIQREFDASDKQIGALTSVFLYVYMCAAPLFGWLSDRYRRWSIVGVGVILWSIASGLSGLAGSIGVMLLTRMFVGIGEAAYGPTAPTMISDLFPVERRGRVMALFYAAIPVGSALGYLLGGRVLHWGFTWHWAFFFVVPPGIALGLVALWMPDPVRSVADGKHHASWREFVDLAKIPSFVLNTIGMAAMTFALGGIAAWMPKYIVWKSGTLMSDAAAVDAATAAANKIFGPIVVVSGLLATLVGGWTGDMLRKNGVGPIFSSPESRPSPDFRSFGRLRRRSFPTPGISYSPLVVACFSTLARPIPSWQT